MKLQSYCKNKTVQLFSYLAITRTVCTFYSLNVHVYAVLNNCSVNIDTDYSVHPPRLLNLGRAGKCETTGLYTLCKYLSV